MTGVLRDAASGKPTSWIKKIIARLGCMNLALVGAGAGESCVPSVRLDAATYTSMVMNAQTGAALVQHQSNTLVYPASLTKLMTLYLAFEALSKGQAQSDTRLNITRLAAGQPPCKWGVVPGQSISMLMGMKILATRSANDIAVAMAETLAPSVGVFVGRMNQTAKSLGMNHTHFVNPSGWHHANQKSTAHDIALLLRALYRRFPQYIHLLGLSGVTKNGQWRRNTNALLGKINGMVAGKTGYTIPAGWNLATLTQRHGMTLITVVMGMPNRIARDRHVEQLTETALSLCQLAQAPQGIGRPNRAPVLVARSVDPARNGRKIGLRPKITAKRRQKSSRWVAQNTPRAKQGRIATSAKRPKKTVSKKSKG